MMTKSEINSVKIIKKAIKVMESNKVSAYDIAVYLDDIIYNTNENCSCEYYDWLLNTQQEYLEEVEANKGMELKIGNIYKYKNDDSWFDSLDNHKVRLIKYRTGGDCKVQLMEKVEDVGWWHDDMIISCKSSELRAIK